MGGEASHPPTQALPHSRDSSTLLWGQGQLLGAAHTAGPRRTHRSHLPVRSCSSVQTLPVQPGDSKPQNGAVTEQDWDVSSRRKGATSLWSTAAPPRGAALSRKNDAKASQPDSRQNAAHRTLASGEGGGIENKHQIKKGLLARPPLLLRTRAACTRPSVPGAGSPPSHAPSPHDRRSWARPCSWPWPPTGPCRVGGAAGEGGGSIPGHSSPQPASWGRPLSCVAGRPGCHCLSVPRSHQCESPRAHVCGQVPGATKALVTNVT